EWSLFLTVRFWDVHPFYRRWFKGFGFECFFETIDVSIKVFQEARLCHPIDSRRYTSSVDRNVPFFYRRWFKGFGFECFFETIDVSIKVFQEARFCHPIDSRRYTSS